MKNWKPYVKRLLLCAGVGVALQLSAFQSMYAVLLTSSVIIGTLIATSGLFEEGDRIC